MMFGKKSSKSKEDELRKEVVDLRLKLQQAETRIKDYQLEIQGLNKELEDERRSKHKMQAEMNGIKKARGSSFTSPGSVRERRMTVDGALSIHDILEYMLRPFKEEELLALASTSCVLLAALHRTGDCHGSLNNHNLKIKEDGTVYFSRDSIQDLQEKFTPPESSSGGARASMTGDVYSLGVTLWSSADYLLEQDEEPDLSDDTCNLIGSMTDDDPLSRPTAARLCESTEKHREFCRGLMVGIMQEVSRKKAIRREYEKQVVEHTKDHFRTVVLKSQRSDQPSSPKWAARNPSPEEKLAQIVENQQWEFDRDRKPIERRKSKHLKGRMSVIIQRSNLERSSSAASFK